MPGERTAQTAIEALNAALDRLERAVDVQVEQGRGERDSASEMKQMLEDRSRLAQELDQSEDRSNRLEEANREVSRRLVTAMETIRAVLDR